MDRVTALFYETMQLLAADFLGQAERLYGPRIDQWKFAGVCLADDGPHIFYAPGPNGVYVQIHLSHSCFHYPDQAQYQLAHEVVHLLAPGAAKAPMVEEGLAVKFSLEAPKFRTANYVQLNLASLPETYRRAYGLVERLLADHPEAIIQLRAKEPRLSNWTPELLTSELPIDRDFAIQLCSIEQMR